jgi:predicted acylesterase/phospholipase RssA
VDTALFERIEQTRSTVSSAFLTQSHATGNFEVDKGDCKWICAIDGGGLRGIFPLRVLEQMERYYSRTCFEMFDMFAGTSTGSLIASALATEVPLRDVLAVYADPVTRRQIFQTNVRGQIHAFRFFDLDPDKEAKQNLDDARYLAFYEDLIESYVGEFKRLIHETAKKVMTPQYLKIGMKQILYQLLSDRSRGILDPYKLGECKKDILVTARDLERPDSTLFSAFHIPHEVYAQPEVALARAQARRFDTGHPEGYYPARTVDVVTGLYQDVLLKDAVEASASAPVYFSPRARFTDGGVGPYNNPSFIAAFEALNRSHIDTSENPVTLRRKYTPYKENGASKSGTVVWSFGTAYKIPGTRRMSLMSCNASSDFALMR